MSLEKNAFNFGQSLTEAKTLDELQTLFDEFASQHGIEHYMFGQLAIPGGVIKTVRLLGAFDSDWFRFYEKNHLFINDPAVRLVKTLDRPYRWSWVRNTFDLTEAELDVFGHAERFGLTDGVFFPFHGAGGSLAGGSVAGPSFDPSDQEIVVLEFIVQQACRRAASILKLFDEPQTTNISKRQRECLNWAQYGKSNQEIGGILGISAHTVKEHIEAAKRVFGVNSRIEAIVFARNAGLIGSSPLSDIVRPPPP